MNTLPTDLELIDSRTVKRMFGIRSNDTLRKRHSKQLLPEPIWRGQKKFWPMQECRVLLAAEIHGLSDGDMQKLVAELMGNRASVFQQLKEYTIH
jgi:hypothetical protein